MAYNPNRSYKENKENETYNPSRLDKKNNKVDDNFYEKGINAFKEGNFENAEIYFTKAIAKDPDIFLIYEFRCSVREKLKNPDLAYQDALKMIELEETSAKGYIRAIRALKQLNQHTKAQEILHNGKQKVIQNGPLYQVLQKLCLESTKNNSNRNPTKNIAKQRRNFVGRSYDFIQLIPNEIVHDILRKLPLKSLCKATLVSKHWRNFINSSPLLWCRLDFTSNQICNRITDQVFRNYAKRANRHLRSLICYESINLSDSSLKILAEHRCTRIEDFEITVNKKITSTRFTMFFKSMGLHLININLLGTMASTQTVKVILETCSALETLNISNCSKISEDPFNPQKVNSKVSNLRELYLQGCPAVSNNTLDYLFLLFPKLVKLDLRDNPELTPRIFDGLSNFSELESTRLRLLKNEYNVMRPFDESFPSFVNSCLRIRDFQFSFFTSLTDSSIQSLTQAWHELEILDLQGNIQLSDQTLRHISENCENLRVLLVGQCPRLTDEGVNFIGNTTLGGLCGSLEIFDISQNPNITNISLMSIADNLINLRELYISNCPMITGSGVAYLARARCDKLRFLAVEGSPNIASDAISYARRVLETRGGKLSHVLNERGKKLFV
ncbi:12042_t:CDS:2 [Ambispora gerdemannii]|uniref:12042_t:CDS:1 n=1 Tax=Ambispora gerdemannii TaxID=144530 RepID=A0A9N9C562_9GLOM|nr:12042_t:CDS:2 [Ambispora gerdemannii]